MKINKNKLNNSGFGHVEAVLAVAVIALVGVIGVYVSRHNFSHAATPTTSAKTQIVTPSPNITCNYQTDTWSGDASKVGYSVKELSAKSGNPGSFSVQLNADKGTTEVVGYPSDQCIMYSVIPTNMASAFNITPPANSKGLDYEFAYDIWLTTAANAEAANWNNKLELMIWTYVNGQVPAGSNTGKTLPNGAQVWYDSTQPTVSVVLPKNKTSGNINIYSMINELKSDGYIPTKDNGDLDMEYGIEAPYGGGQTFIVNSVSDGTIN